VELTFSDPVLLWTLLLFRLTGMVFIAPLFSAVVIPGRIKAAIIVVLSFMLLPGATAELIGPVVVSPATLMTEVLTGLVVGLGAAVFVGAAEVAGDILAIQMGLSGASIVDPMSRNQVPVVGQLLSLMTLMMILSSGGHIYMISALDGSLGWVPPGTTIDMGAGVGIATQIGAALFTMGLKFAAPVIGALMIGHVALGVLARTAPQMNVLMMAFPLQIALGLFVMGVTLPAVAMSFIGWPMSYGEFVAELLERLAPVEGGV